MADIKKISVDGEDAVEISVVDGKIGTAQLANTAVTKAKLATALQDYIDAGYRFMGVAPSLQYDPTEDFASAYLLTTAGTYVNFSNLEVEEGEIAIAFGDGQGTWTAQLFNDFTDEERASIIASQENLSELAGDINILYALSGGVICSATENTYFSFNFKVGQKVTFIRLGVAQYIYLRKEKNNTGQLVVSPTATGVTITLEDNYKYLYLYTPSQDNLSFKIKIESETDVALNNLSNNLTSLDARVKAEFGKYSICTLLGTATSRAVLNTPIILSTNGDILEIDYSTLMEGNQALSFAASGLEGSPTYGYAIALGKTTFRMRGSDGWMMDMVTFAERASGRLKIEYKDNKIYCYIDDTLISTIESQSTLTIAGFGYGGNNTASYGYWGGVIGKIVFNGTIIDLAKDAELTNVSQVTKYRFADAEEFVGANYPDGILVYNSTEKSFTHYERRGKSNHYFSFKMQLMENDSVFLKEWRLVDGGMYLYDGVNLTRIANTLINAENEMAMKFSNGNYNGGYTGGSHGGEKVDGDAYCGAFFFADGILIDSTMMNADFTMDCKVFSYIQISTLHNSDNNDAIRAHHVKKNTFCEGKSELENTIKFVGNDSLIEYHSGLACIAKDAATYAILPNYVQSGLLSGNDATILSDNYEASEIIMWNPTNGIQTRVDSHFLQGFAFGDKLPSEGLFCVWDRVNDTKYYRRTRDVIYSFSANDVIRNWQRIQFL